MFVVFFTTASTTLGVSQSKYLPVPSDPAQDKMARKFIKFLIRLLPTYTCNAQVDDYRVDATTIDIEPERQSKTYFGLHACTSLSDYPTAN